MAATNALAHAYERRSATVPATTPDLGDADITIKHPGYSLVDPPLLFFKGFDRLQDIVGIHHGTILTACAIISGRNDGHLTRARDGQELNLPLEDIVKGGVYYYVVPGDDKYPIYPGFRYWRFPHGNLPRGWTLPSPIPSTQIPAPAPSNITHAVLARDKQCLLSVGKDIIERAHLCPELETEWFLENGMVQYNRSFNQASNAVTNDLANLITLRKDVHVAFDLKRMFVIVPKAQSWLVHFLQPSNTLGPLYHNMKADLSQDIAPEHLLTRFAWAIFPQVQYFLQQGRSRWIRQAVPGGEGTAEDEIKQLDRATIIETYFSSQARTPSPKKRGRSNTEQPIQAEFADIQENKRRKIWKSQDTTASNPPSFTTSQSSVKSISIATASINPNTSLPEESILEYDCGDDGIADPDPRVHRLYDSESPLDRLRRFELKRRRPDYHPQMFCCDYDQRDKVIHAAIKDEGEWDAYALCDECLGGEYQLRAEDVVDEDEGAGLEYPTNVGRLSDCDQDVIVVNEEGRNTNDALMPTPTTGTDILRDDASESGLYSFASTSKKRYDDIRAGREYAPDTGLDLQALGR
ncbi:MAG: hypothetical protein Q9220_007609 [cf. Caloplaca sp. 1 TL-2023]